jgi:DNA-binding transcriptional ArsR family regulator
MRNSLLLVWQRYFVYNQSVNVASDTDEAVARIAAAIGERARARMLYALLDGQARTSTELAVVAEVTPSTASVHLHRLKEERLVKVYVQGKHHYFSLVGPQVARALEGLSVLAGGPNRGLGHRTPQRLRTARTCYDHMAGALGVALSDRILALGWLTSRSTSENTAYELTPGGTKAFGTLGIDVAATLALRRRLAYACLDWSERRPHIGGALGAALLNLALRKNWVAQDPDSRALELTRIGRRELLARLGLEI